MADGLAPSFTFVDHTADLAARLTAETLDGLFEAAAAALMDALTVRERIEPREAEPVALAAAEPELLLVDWLNELLFRFEVRGRLVAETSVRVEPRGDGWGLEAETRGEPRDPVRHPIKVLVKAVTYHGLRIERRNGRYETTIVFDI